MEKEQLIKKELTTQKELCENLILFYGFEKASEDEKRNWPYKNELLISIKNIINKKFYHQGEYIGIVEDCVFGKSDRGHESVRVKAGGREFSITGSQVNMYDKFDEKEILVDLHPSRKGIKFWTFGYITTEKNYKSLYYKTTEYRNKFEKTLNENLGTIGLRAPIQSQEIKDRISNTMVDRYGSKWFLERGLHYSAITNTMQEKFGVDNLFYSDEWQREVHKLFDLGISKLEKEIVSYLIDEYGEEGVFCCFKDKEQMVVLDKYNKKSYRIDYVNKKKGIFVEVNGDYWHCNPEKYDKDFFNTKKEKYAHEIWEYDKNRIFNIKNITKLKPLIIWENDWKNNKELIKKIIKETFDESK